MTIINANAWLFPASADKFGWGLRVRPLEFWRTYLSKESVYHNQLSVVLINRSDKRQDYTPLKTARQVGELQISIVHSTGKTLKSEGYRYLLKVNAERPSLDVGQFARFDFSFEHFGYDELSEAGEYELRASLKTAEGLIVAPAVKLKVIEPDADDILFSQTIPLEGYQAKWPKEKQDRAVLQQIKIGDRIWLFYRKFLSAENGGKVTFAYRVAELSGKCEMKVEGAFGDWNPLTITYKAAPYHKFTTTLVINSVDGKPWTAEEEKHRQEKLKKPAPVPEKK